MKAALRCRLAVVSAVAVLSFSTGSPADPWKLDASANAGIALNSYSTSWVGGEAGSFTWNTQFLGIAERQLSPMFNTQTTLKLQFGQTKVQDKTSKVWSVPQKSTDLIDGQELLRLTLGSWIDPFASVRLISEFLDGSDTALTRYFNPLDITEALGGSRTFVKNDNVTWSGRLGAAVHQLINRQSYDPASAGRKTDVVKDGGAEFDMDLTATNKQKWASLISSLRVYEALVSSQAKSLEGTPKENDWRYPHVKWENTLTLSFAKYLMLNVLAYAYYDKDISSNIRFKENFSAGITYIYSNKKKS